MKLNFLGLPDGENPRVALIPAPLEFTTSWKKGTKEAPLEILKVSPNIEFFDEETEKEPVKILGFYTYPVPELSSSFNSALKEVSQTVESALKKRLFPIVIGGEHTVSFAVVEALEKFYPKFKVLHLDAHLDQRDSYLGTKINHATVMRRILEKGHPVLSIGIRSCSKEEYEFFKKTKNLEVIWAKDIKEDFEKVLKKIEEFVKDSLFYLSFDMDVFDPAVAPGVGTPEPGGLFWHEALQILKSVVKYSLIGFDLVEVMPLPCHQITEYTAVRLIFKLCAYLSEKYEKTGALL
jgi:agmatinase